MQQQRILLSTFLANIFIFVHSDIGPPVVPEANPQYGASSSGSHEDLYTDIEFLGTLCITRSFFAIKTTRALLSPKTVLDSLELYGGCSGHLLNNDYLGTILQQIIGTFWGASFSML
ncbi:hypothetical protein ACJX0J_041959, partial [Zea mays]